MTLEDLEYIFEYQIEEGTTKLYFMLIDGDAMPVIERHPVENLAGLLPMLGSFQYVGHNIMPRFKK
jgi:hypothetical protein